MLLQYFLLSVSAVALVAEGADRPDMWGLINILYVKADTNDDGQITVGELSSIYLGLDTNKNGIVSQDEFVKGWSAISMETPEVALAYFQLSDIDHNGQLDSNDRANIFIRFDLDHDGFVSDKEFVREYKFVYHTVPFIVLLDREYKASGSTAVGTSNDPELNKAQFESLFKSFNTEADGSITKASLEKAWVDNYFGVKSDADNVMALLDVNSDGSISKTELGTPFDTLDTGNDGKLNIDELKLILLMQTPSKSTDSIIG